MYQVRTGAQLCLPLVQVIVPVLEGLSERQGTRAREGLEGGIQTGEKAELGPGEQRPAGGIGTLELWLSWSRCVRARRVTMSDDGMGPQMPSRWFGVDG